MEVGRQGVKGGGRWREGKEEGESLGGKEGGYKVRVHVGQNALDGRGGMLERRGFDGGPVKGDEGKDTKVEST